MWVVEVTDEIYSSYRTCDLISSGMIVFSVGLYVTSEREALGICGWVWGKLCRDFKTQRVHVKKVECQTRNCSQSKILKRKSRVG